MRHISKSSLMALVPEPTPQDLAELEAHRAKRAAEQAQRAADEAAHAARMHGRSVEIGGHDGKVWYVTFTRPGGYRRIWRVPLPERATCRTLRLLRLVQASGGNIHQPIGWSI